MTEHKLYSDVPVLWRVSGGLVAYPEAEAFMEARARDIAAGKTTEQVWLLEHPPLYSAGTSAKQGDLVDPDRFEVFETGRGGQYTYHGPGQRVAYVMLDLTTARTGCLCICAHFRAMDYRQHWLNLDVSCRAAERTGRGLGGTRRRPRGKDRCHWSAA